jgi:polyisoprenoid-binding protein YceI
MTKWTFEPGHTAAEFSARHMMVTFVRGHFKYVKGKLEYDPVDPRNSSVEAVIDVKKLSTGDADRDAHLLSADFLDAENYPEITFKGNQVELNGSNDGKVTGDLTLRGITRKVTLEVRCLGQWQTPYWEGGQDKGPKTRMGFLATTRINRRDFNINWQAPMDNGGLVVSDDVDLTIDAEAILDQ